MASCECCWGASYMDRSVGMDPNNAYHAAMRDHEERGCECTKDTLEGRRKRAGQFWDHNRDTREAAP